MMKTKNILLTLIFILSAGFISANAQDRQGRVMDRKLTPEIKEKIQKMRSEFLKKELRLTDDEFNTFIPLYDEYADKKFALGEKARDGFRKLRDEQNRTEDNLLKIIDEDLEVQIKEAQLQKEYYQKFKKVLPAEKLIELKRTELRFMEEAVTNFRRQEGRERGNLRSSEPLRGRESRNQNRAE